MSTDQKIEKIEKQDGRKKNGGKRKKSGRKPDLDKKTAETIKQLIAKHGAEEIVMETPGGKTVKMTRILALLDRLFVEGYVHKNIVAIKEYLDRQLGKSVQPISGEKDAPPIQIEIKESQYASIIRREAHNIVTRQGSSPEEGGP